MYVVFDPLCILFCIRLITNFNRYSKFIIMNNNDELQVHMEKARNFFCQYNELTDNGSNQTPIRSKIHRHDAIELMCSSVECNTISVYGADVLAISKQLSIIPSIVIDESDNKCNMYYVPMQVINENNSEQMDVQSNEPPIVVLYNINESLQNGRFSK